MVDTLIRVLTAMGFMAEALLVVMGLELGFGWISRMELAIGGTLFFAVLAASSLYGWITANAWLAGARVPLPSVEWLFNISLPQLHSEPQMSAQARYEATIERLSQSQIRWVKQEGGK